LVVDQFAREMEFRCVEVSRVRAFGARTVFMPAEGQGAQKQDILIYRC